MKYILFLALILAAAFSLRGYSTYDYESPSRICELNADIVSNAMTRYHLATQDPESPFFNPDFKGFDAAEFRANHLAIQKKLIGDHFLNQVFFCSGKGNWYLTRKSWAIQGVTREMGLVRCDLHSPEEEDLSVPRTGDETLRMKAQLAKEENSISLGNFATFMLIGILLLWEGQFRGRGVKDHLFIAGRKYAFLIQILMLSGLWFLLPLMIHYSPSQGLGQFTLPLILICLATMSGLTGSSEFNNIRSTVLNWSRRILCYTALILFFHFGLMEDLCRLMILIAEIDITVSILLISGHIRGGKC